MTAALSFHTTGDHEDTISRVERHLAGAGGGLDIAHEVLLNAHDVPLFLYAARAYPPHIPHGCPAPEVIHGAGCGVTRAAALASAYGETVERYSAWRCCTPEAIRATAHELGAQAIDLQRLVPYAEAQYGADFHFQRLHETTVLHWVEGQSWTHNRPVYLPTCFVYQGPCTASSRRVCYHHAVSTGLACGTTAEAAILSGLLECIERDGIVRAWFSGLELQRVEPPPGEPALARLYQCLAQKHLRATVLDATTDVGVPVRIAMVEIHGEMTECAVGMAARVTPLAAHYRAVLEACHTLNYLHRLQQRRPPLPWGQPCTPQTFEDHVFLYGHAWAQPYLDIWRTGPWCQETLRTTTTDTTPRQQLHQLVNRLAALNLEVVTVEVTLPEVAAAGFQVWRTVVPGLAPLTVGCDAPLGSPRLRTMTALQGCNARYRPHLNPYPHPFP